MANRLHDASAELRVRFTEGERTQEFVASVRAEKYTPMVVTFKSDQISNKAKVPGGLLTLESRAPIVVDRRAALPLPYEMDVTIEAWLDVKRREFREIAAKKVREGAATIRINEDGEMRRI